MRHARSGIVVVATMALAGCAGPQAPSDVGARWETASLLGEGATPQLVGDGVGGALAVWTTSDGPQADVVASRYQPASGWSQAFVVSRRPVRGFSLAAAPSGEAVLAWGEGDPAGAPTSRVHACRTGSVGACDDPQVVSTPDGPAIVWAYTPLGLSVSARGVSAIAWAQPIEGGHRIWVSRAEPRGSFPLASLVAAVEGTPSRVRVAVDGTGAALVVWQTFVPGVGRIQSCRLAPGQSSCNVETIATFAKRFWLDESPAVAVLPSDEAHVVWTQGGELRGERGEVWSARYVPGLGWEQPVEIGPDRAIAPGETAASAPKVVASGSVAMAVWEQSNDAGHFHDVWSARYVAGPGWEPARLVESRDEPAYQPGLTVSADGGGLTAWFQGPYDASLRLWTRRFDRMGNWGSPEEVPRSLDRFLPSAPPQMAAESSSGEVLMVWGENPGLPGQAWIWYSRLLPVPR